MGANFYTNFGEGTSPRAIFDSLRASAEAEHGHRQGYSGEINMAHGYRVVQSEPLTPAQARALAERYEEQDRCEKGGEACAVPVADVTVKAERVVKVKVQAATAYEAQRSAEARPAGGEAPRGLHGRGEGGRDADR